MPHIDTAANETVKATFDRVTNILNSTQTEDFLDIITVKNNPMFIGIFCGCVFLTAFCAFMWSYFRTDPSEGFAFSLSMSVSSSKQTSHKDGQHGRESVFNL